jgi:hypothetical protein
VKALVLLLAFFAISAAAETPAPGEPKAQSPESAPKPRPPLKLNLDEVDPPHSRLTFTPREDRKKDPAASLPGMGGASTGSWERPSDQVFPPDTNPNAR